MTATPTISTTSRFRLKYCPTMRVAVSRVMPTPTPAMMCRLYDSLLRSLLAHFLPSSSDHLGSKTRRRIYGPALFARASLPRARRSEAGRRGGANWSLRRRRRRPSGRTGPAHPSFSGSNPPCLRLPSIINPSICAARSKEGENWLGGRAGRASTARTNRSRTHGQAGFSRGRKRLS